MRADPAPYGGWQMTATAGGIRNSEFGSRFGSRKEKRPQSRCHLSSVICHLAFSFRLPNSEFRIPNSEFLRLHLRETRYNALQQSLAGSATFETVFIGPTRVCRCRLLLRRQRPEARDQPERQRSQQNIQNNAHFDEVLEAITAGTVNHQAGLIAHWHGESG